MGSHTWEYCAQKLDAFSNIVAALPDFQPVTHSEKVAFDSLQELLNSYRKKYSQIEVDNWKKTDSTVRIKRKGNNEDAIAE